MPNTMGILHWLNPLNWFRRNRGLRTKVTVPLYQGDIHPVVDVEGIGPTFEKKLATVGILNTDQLLAHPAEAIATAIDTTPKRVQTWQAMAELAIVDGIGPQYAEALARGGVDGIEDLVARDAKVIADEVNDYLGSLDATVTGGKVSTKRMQTWQKAAEGMTRVKTKVILFGETLEPVSKQARKDAGKTTTATGTNTTGRGNAKTGNGATKTTTRTTRTTTTSNNPTCAALTNAGNPCKRVARDGSKYCATHKGYRPTTTATGTTGNGSTKTPKTTTGTGNGTTGKKVQVTHNGYKLYQKGNRFYFSKKTQAEVAKDGAEPVFEMPANREVKVTQNGLPVLKTK